MSSVAIYLNFSGQTEQAFAFYKSIFGGDFTSMTRMSDAPPAPGRVLSDEEKNMIMNIQYPILGGYMLMGSDVPSAYGPVVGGNNFSISLQVDGVEEGAGYFAGLAAGGKVNQPYQEMFWGHWGSVTDKFGIRWMVNCMKS